MMWSARRTVSVEAMMRPLPYDMWICERGHVYITKPGLVLSCQRDGCDARGRRPSPQWKRQRSTSNGLKRDRSPLPPNRRYPRTGLHMTDPMTFAQWLEAWCSGYNARKDGQPDDETILSAAHDAWQQSGEQRAAELLERAGT